MTGPRSSPETALVVGAGLAGLTAALRLADSGVQVTVLEARPRVGGATSSFTRDGVSVDTGQHVFLGCCDAYRALLRRLAVEHCTTLQPRLDVPVLLADRTPPGRARLRRSRLPLPPPLHLTGALLGYTGLCGTDRLAAVGAALALGRLDLDDPAVDGQSFEQWLTAHGQSARSREALWGLLTVAALNAPPGQASLALAAKVVQTGLLERRDGADIGMAAVPLGQLHGEAAVRALHAAGATVHTRAKVQRLTADAGQFVADTRSGQVRADVVVLAVPPAPAAALLPSAAAVDLTGMLRRGGVPIINLHVFYDRVVLERPFFAAVGSPVQWVFDRTAAAGVGRGQYLAISLSAANDWMGWPSGRLAELFVPELARLLPAAGEARVERVLVTREPAATFDQSPGQAAVRPGPATALAGLALAGAWTRTGWPATMEGAVRSGHAAVDHLLGSGRTATAPVHSGVAA